jgi:hypothetical protein
MTDTNNCINVLRAKLSTFDPDSQHYYHLQHDLVGQVHRTVEAP